MQRRDKNFYAQLDMRFYASELAGSIGSPTCMRVSAPRTWMVGLGGVPGWGSPLAIENLGLPIVGPNFNMSNHINLSTLVIHILIKLFVYILNFLLINIIYSVINFWLFNYWNIYYRCYFMSCQVLYNHILYTYNCFVLVIISTNK
jgi:hypothetical protein